MTLTKDRVDRAISLIKKGSANADYFFEKLESPAWIEPLRKEGLFSEPYAAVRRGEMISFPFWGPGQYLARMAAVPAAQALVLQILMGLPKCDNPRVYEVVAEAAATLPPAMARQLVPQLLHGVDLPIPLSLPQKIGAAIVHLADGNCGREAVCLTEALLRINSSPAPADEEDDKDRLRWFTREARGRIDDWQYGDVLEKVLKSVVRSSGLKAFQVLCDLLEAAVEAGRKYAGTGPDDYSYIWRPSIEHSDSRRENVRDELVSAVRDAANLIVEAAPTELAEVISRLSVRATKIFHRIALFVLLQQGEPELELVRSSLANPSDWADVGLHPEYELLLARFFYRLSPNEQQLFLDWINQGPDLPRYILFRREMDGEDPKERDIDLYRDVWIRDHLAVLAPYLSDADKERLTTLERIGPSQQVGRPVYRISVTARGEHSPLTNEETLSIDWPSLIAKMRDWSPPASGDFEGPSLEGLAGSVRQRVSANAGDAVQHLREVVDVGPQYISAILEALREAIKQKVVLPWEPLLNFVGRIVGEAQGAHDALDQWRWVSKCAASLIGDSFDSGAASVPLRFRTTVWEILERLAQNPDPTQELEDGYAGSNMDPTTLSLNTVRGETFHAVFRYCLWVRRHLESLPDASDRLKRGFDEQPEARDLLDRHLDPRREPSLAVRTVYGQWFPWLVLIDPVFAKARVEWIFPLSPEQTSLFWAAWGAYIVFCRPYTNVLPLLRSIYQRAIDEVGDRTALKVAHFERPSEHLADHLMAYYWRGELTLSADDLVTDFFASADPKLAGHALEWIGRALRQLEEAAPPNVKERLTVLWEWRMSATPLAPDEVRAFGWWFASGQMNGDWSLQMLARLLSLSVLPEPDHMVVERLAIVANDHPLQALESLDRLIDLASAGWSIHGWLDSARTILELGLRSGDEEARALAERVIHKLGALRFRDFRALLKSIGDRS